MGGIARTLGRSVLGKSRGGSRKMRGGIGGMIGQLVGRVKSAMKGRTGGIKPQKTAIKRAPQEPTQLGATNASNQMAKQNNAGQGPPSIAKTMKAQNSQMAAAGKRLQPKTKKGSGGHQQIRSFGN